MAESFFSKFNTINYNNSVAVDLTQRTKLLDSIQKNPYLFYPYDIDSYDRPDQVAERYYNDAYMSWILYYANNVVDPYYQWYVPTNDFNDFVAKKYGSIEVAMSKIVNFRNNWYDDPDDIDVRTFNELDFISQRYYTAVYNNGRIAAYQRKKVDNVRNTNKIIAYDVQNVVGTFLHDEIIIIKISEGLLGSAQIINASDSVIRVQHAMNNVTGTLINAAIYGTQSHSTAEITAYTVVRTVIDSAEARFWSPVTAYDMENEINQQNKTIKVMDRSYSLQTSRQLTNLLEGG